MRFVVATVLAVVCAACAGAPPNPCEPVDPVLQESAFVVVIEPTSGQRVPSPFRVTGCSRSFESNVLWELRARDGRVLSGGHAIGGGVEGAEAFRFEAAFDLSSPEVGHLYVFEDDVSDGEGFPPGRVVIPLVLVPGESGR